MKFLQLPRLIKLLLKSLLSPGGQNVPSPTPRTVTEGHEYLHARTSPQVKMKGKNSISGRENELSGLIRKTWEGLHDKAVAQIC